MIKVENLSQRKNVVKYQTHSIKPEPKPSVNKIVSDETYTTNGELLIIVKNVDKSEISLNSEKNQVITIKSLTSILIKPDLGKIDEEWDELQLDKGACVVLNFVEGNWYVSSSDGLKLN